MALPADTYEIKKGFGFALIRVYLCDSVARGFEFIRVYLRLLESDLPRFTRPRSIEANDDFSDLGVGFDVRLRHR